MKGCDSLSCFCNWNALNKIRRLFNQHNDFLINSKIVFSIFPDLSDRSSLFLYYKDKQPYVSSAVRQCWSQVSDWVSPLYCNAASSWRDLRESTTDTASVLTVGINLIPTGARNDYFSQIEIDNKKNIIFVL